MRSIAYQCDACGHMADGTKHDLDQPPRLPLYWPEGWAQLRAQPDIEYHLCGTCWPKLKKKDTQ